MARHQLFEWEDQPWLPRVLRDYLTDHLFLYLSSDEAGTLHSAIAGILRPALDRLRTDRIVDLCSGGGGPLLAVQRHLQSDMQFTARVTLTDLYPNVAAFRRAVVSSNGSVQACFEAVSAFDVPAHLSGLRTLFTAFHHFRPPDARRVLQDAVAKGQGIAVLERNGAIIKEISLPNSNQSEKPTATAGHFERMAYWSVTATLAVFSMVEVSYSPPPAVSVELRWVIWKTPC